MHSNVRWNLFYLYPRDKYNSSQVLLCSPHILESKCRHAVYLSNLPVRMQIMKEKISAGYAKVTRPIQHCARNS
jgi:hypothetical protein